jgi:hypothetical protein
MRRAKTRSQNRAENARIATIVRPRAPRELLLETGHPFNASRSAVAKKPAVARTERATARTNRATAATAAH